MSSAASTEAVFPDSKKHFEILDGLRGVAAVIVVAFHIFEYFANGDHTKQIINHGYLAVDFFFLLSGFVIVHAYDDRWGTMTLKDFFKRRIIRLHPMIIMGMLIGGICFYPSAAEMFPAIEATPVWKLILVTAIGFTLLPVTAALDIRGWGEMYPTNGPAWSLFYEYIANICYALFLRKASNTVLAILTVIAGAALVHFAVFGGQGDVIGGWSLDAAQIRLGLTRLAFPFLAGMLLRRLYKGGSVKNAFLWSSLLVAAVLAFPRVGGSDNLWMNGIYDSLAIILMFPIIIYVGASGRIENTAMQKVCRFLGDISYPIYITHYAWIYLYYAWIQNNNVATQDAWPVGILVFIVSIVAAYAALKLYDAPVRKWLTERLIKR